VLDRSLPVELVRQSRDDRAKRFREREAEANVATIRAELEAWAQQPGLIDTLRDARPALPEELTDRQQDYCEPLLAIADMAGGD
jgi:putative DNA primase/helicase